MAISDLYQEMIFDHYRRPRHAGTLRDADVVTRQANPVCGDELTLYLKVKDDRVAEVAFEAAGCSISQASASVMTEQVLGRTLADGLGVGDAFGRLVRGEESSPDESVLGDGIAFGGVARYPVRVKCALLGWMAFKEAALRVSDGGGDDH